MTQSCSPEIPAWLATLWGAATRMPVPESQRPPAVGGRRSAILVLFAESQEGPDVLLIQRSNGLRRHSGQPAFPGGAIEPTDAGPVACALREAEEEAGVTAAAIEVLGTLPEFYLSHSGFRVTPVLGWWHSPGEVAPVDTDEVAAVARVLVADLADPANRIRVRHPDGSVGPAFRVHDMVVWGFTAGVLSRLLTLGGWERPWLETAGELVDAPLGL